MIPPAEEPPFTTTPPDPEAPRFRLWVVIGLLVALAAAIFTRTVDDYFLAAVQVLPFAALGVLAYVAVRQDWAFAIGALWSLLLLALLGGLCLLFLMALQGTRAGNESGGGLAVGMVPAAGWRQIGYASLWWMAGMAVGAGVLLPGARRWIARWLPIDPASRVHALALSFTLGAVVICLGQLIATGGEPVILGMIKADPKFAEELAREDIVASMLYSMLWSVPVAAFTVGFPVARRLPEALRRLGFVRPSGRQVGGAIGVAVLLVLVAGGLDAGITWLWKLLGWPTTDAESVEKLFQSLMTPLGAVVIGITAGVEEELVARGALQPRLGIVLANLFFVSLHALQYSWDGLVSVLVIGLVLGVVRLRTNTTTCCIVHGVYDFIVVMLAVFHIGE